MKKILLLLSIAFFLALNIKAQENWYANLVIYNTPIPDLNSVFIYDNWYGLTCGSKGYIGIWTTSTEDEDAWFWWNNLSITQNLYSVFIIDSNSVKKSYCVGEGGLILKSNIFHPANYYFQNSNTPNDLYSLYFSTYSNGIAVGKNGTIVRTTDGGNHWFLINSGTTNTLFSIQFPSNNIGYTCGTNGTILKTNDNGQNWLAKTQPVNDSLRCVWFVSDNTGFVVSRNGAIFKTTNGGDNWQSKNSGTNQNLNAIRFASLSKGYAAGNNNIIVRSTDGGENWVSVSLPPLYHYGNFRGLGIDVSTSSFVAAVGTNATAASTRSDAGNINENTSKDMLMLYPNPAQNKIYINLQAFQTPSALTLHIFNLHGQLLLQQTLSQNNTQIDISQLQSGVYIAKVKVSDGSFIQERFVVVK